MEVRTFVMLQPILGLKEPGGYDPYESLGSSLYGSTALHSWSRWRSGKFRQFFRKEKSSFSYCTFFASCVIVNKNIRANKQRTGKKFLYVYVYFHDTVLL